MIAQRLHFSRLHYGSRQSQQAKKHNLQETSLYPYHAMNHRVQQAISVINGLTRLALHPSSIARCCRNVGQHGSTATIDGMSRLLDQSVAISSFAAWYSAHGKWIHQFQNRYAGEECFLIGNGPSINKVDLPALGRFHLIGLNKIFLLFDRQPLNLTFHVAINSLVIEQSWKQFLKLDCPSFLSYIPAREFVPDDGNIHYILTEQRAEPRFSHVSEEPIWEGWTVTYAALQIAFFMGFRRVFLIGVDHNFATSGSPNEQQGLIGNDTNHFDPRYFSGQQWHLPDLDGSEMAYQMARFTYERNGGAIFDATIDGKCTVFPKMDIAKAFAECRPRF